MLVLRILRLSHVACLLLGVAAANLRAQPPREAPPTPILTGGGVFTADSAHPWAEAVAIRGEGIAAVGTTAEVRRLGGRSTREVALGGRLVIPGINDAHNHLGEAGLGPEFRTGLSPTPDPATSQVLDSLRVLATRLPAGTRLRT
jgi:predicted amidohydrolase YtcJ